MGAGIIAGCSTGTRKPGVLVSCTHWKPQLPQLSKVMARPWLTAAWMKRPLPPITSAIGVVMLEASTAPLARAGRSGVYTKWSRGLMTTSS